MRHLRRAVRREPAEHDTRPVAVVAASDDLTVDLLRVTVAGVTLAVAIAMTIAR